jgi:Fasciclin domain
MRSNKYSHRFRSSFPGTTSFLWSLLLICSLAACHKVKETPTSNLPSLRQYIASDSTLSLLQLALQRAGLDSLLATGGPFTLFAPVNSAFLSAGLTADSIGGFDPAALRNLIGYSLVTGRIGSATLQGFVTDSAVSAVSPFPPLLTQNYFGLFIDGIPVTQGNIALADGILHKTARIALPPTGSLLQLLDSLPNTTMAAYIVNNSAGLKALATNPGPLFVPYATLQEGQITVSSYNDNSNGMPYTTVTFLMPSDSAFRQYGFNSTADLAALDSATRTNLIENCILWGSFFTSDFMGGQIVGNIRRGQYSIAPGISIIPNLDAAGLYVYDTLYGNLYYSMTNSQQSGDISYEIGTDGVSLLGNGIVTSPRIVQPNFVTTGGVLHIINQVFVPTGQYAPGNLH